MATRPKAAKTPAPVVEPEVVAPSAVVVTETVVEAAEVPADQPVQAMASASPAIAPVSLPKLPVPEIPKHPMEKVVKTAEEFVAFGQGNIEAFVKSSQIWAAGVQDLSKQAAATAQTQFEETMAAFKAMTSVKSLKDLFELQSSFAKSAMEKTMAESGKITDASVKLTEQALAPITARVTIAVESFGKAA
jgi:phasin family protein